MKYSYNWLKELTGTEESPEKLASLITLKGFEFEEIVDLGKSFDGFVVGKILEIRKHPNADKLQITIVDVGNAYMRPLQIVCGAWNIRVGDVVPVALPGAIVPLNKMKVEARDVRGEKSEGMLCAEDELGLGKDHSGIMILDENIEVGSPLAKALGLDDTVLDFSILPNRAHDCLSYEGMAREICAMEDRKLESKDLDVKIENSKDLNITIEDEQLCPRYMGAVLKNIKIAPSPKWMQQRLVASGMEPINNVVDITNYVMLEVGNPLHAFDKAQLTGDSIIIRKAKKDEKLELLDGTNLDLNENDLVIADSEKALALAGIKGGKYSGISNNTNEIILESANFNSFNVRKTRQRHSLFTEAQSRFEKGISPVLAERAMARAIELLKEHAGATLQIIVNSGQNFQTDQTVDLEISYVSRLLGYETQEEKIIKILENLGFELIENQGSSYKLEPAHEEREPAQCLTFKVPYWRLDIEGQEDLIEEVGRIIGYEKIDETPIVRAIDLPAKNIQREFEWKLKDIFVSLGFDEVLNYSFYGEDDIETCGISSNHFEIENPLTPEHKFMRQTLIPGILRNVSHNEKYFPEFSVFEIGRIYLLCENNSPREKLMISGAHFDSSVKDEELFYSLKGKLQALLGRAAEKNIECTSVSKLENKIFNIARTAEIKIKGENLGMIGEVDNLAAKKYGIKKKAIVFEFDFEKLMSLQHAVKEYQPLRKYPTVGRDISLFVAYKTETSSVIQVIQKLGSNLLLDIDLFDVYMDKEKNRKSLAFHLTFGSDGRTLEGEEVDKLFDKITNALQKDLNAEVRKN